MKEAAKKALEAKFKEFFLEQMAEQQRSGLLWINPSQEVSQQQMVTMPHPVLAQANTASAQSSVASTGAQPYPVDYISISTACLLLYPVGRAGKMKKVAKAQVDPVGGSFEGNPISPLHAYVKVQHVLKSSYEDHEIDIPTADGKHCLGECLGSTILWHK
jgi:hypothetical protein